MNQFLIGAVASGGHKAAQISFGDHHLPLHWVGLGMLIATIVTWLIFRWRGARLKRRLNSARNRLERAAAVTRGSASPKSERRSPVVSGTCFLAASDRGRTLATEPQAASQFTSQSPRFIVSGRFAAD
jgi:hypothetical protein